VFEEETDYQLYLEWLEVYSRKYSLTIWAYCLMSNHVHFVAVPREPDSMARTFNTLHMRYAQHYNERHGGKGHLWQGRYFSCALDERHLYAAVRYVENNPVRARIVRKAGNYKWSSAAGHINGRDNLIEARNCYLTDGIRDWAAYLEEKDDNSLIQTIRENTRIGRPCGDDNFIKKIEGLLDRRLAALPVGRPRRNK
jgi:putative transposase